MSPKNKKQAVTQPTLQQPSFSREQPGVARPQMRGPAKARKYHIPAKDREYLISNLALLLKAAVPVGEALQSLQDSSNSRQLKATMEQMRRDTDDGVPLWKALERSGIAAEQTLALVRLGESSGKLVGNLEVAAKQEEKQRIFRSKVKSALLYPVFVLGLTAVVGLAVAWFLLPRLSATFSQLNLALPPITKFFIRIGLFLKNDGLWAMPTIFVVFGVAMYILFGAPKTKHLGNTILFHTPGVSKLLYEVEVARFGYLLGTLLEAGLSVTQALELLEHATTAQRYQKFYHYMHDSFDDGYGFRASLPKYKHSNLLLPPSVQQMIFASERSGSLPETLRDVGRIYEEKADISTQNLETTLEPILLVLVAGGVMGVAIAVILPIYKLVGGLNGA